MKWYQQAIPRIKDYKQPLLSFSQSSRKFEFVHGVYIFGKNVDKFNDPNYRVKDVDILIDTSLESGDLLAVDNTKNGALDMPQADLEDFGFNVSSVSFTKNMLQHKIANIDFWVGSADKKLLHWGTISDTLEDWYRIKKEAECHAESLTNLSKFEVIKANEDQQQKWNEVYESYMNSFTKDCPQGWYESDNCLETIIKQSIKLDDEFLTI